MNEITNKKQQGKYMKPKPDSLRRSNPSYTDFIKRESTNCQNPE